MSTFYLLLVSVCMAVLVLLCRAFFLIPRDELPMPNWLRRGLHYAPIAALAAVVTPELVMTQGHLIETWRDARIFGAAAALACYVWNQSLLGTILCGTGVMLGLRFALGW